MLAWPLCSQEVAVRDASLAGLTLHVADLQRSVEFYKRIPGAALLFHQPDQFAMVRIGTGRLGLLKAQSVSFHVELETNDLDGMYDQLRLAGIEPQAPPAVRPWGERDFLVNDPDGNLIEFGETHEAPGADPRK